MGRERGAMAAESHNRLFRLVSFQIGDMQSYVSRLFLFLPCDKSSLVFLVDNGPWTVSASRSRPAELWQVMVTKSRVSPFANHRIKRSECSMEAPSKNLEKAGRHNWDAVLYTLRLRCRALVHSQIICAHFHGCVTFEVLWTDVRGMNYLNELQTDTCLSLEVKVMRKRDFDSLDQALSFYECGCDATQVSGIISQVEAEVRKHKEQVSEGEECFTPPASRRSIGLGSPIGDVTFRLSPLEAEIYEASISRGSPPVTKQQATVTYLYRDVLVVFKFSDAFLPFELKDIITADQKLLKMLESGLPSWVVFLQSYPVVSQIYRPWMRPLARTVYFLVSVVTVMIGFYDLYKNVPVLKATAAHMLGPLFDWVESWEMVSRLKYLGTMLVLQNYEKGFVFIKATRQLLSLLTRPILEPLRILWSFFVPLWASVAEWMQLVGRIFETFISSMLLLVGNLIGLLIWPFCVFLSTLWRLGYAVLAPVYSTFRLLVLSPVYIVQSMSEIGAAMLYDTLNVLKTTWQTGQALWGAGSPIVSTVQTAETPSLWKGLWDDLFSKVFRGIRYIINGLLAFFAALNRHRLSIYNNMVAFFFRVIHFLQSGKRLARDTWCQLRQRCSSRRPEQVKED